MCAYLLHNGVGIEVHVREVLELVQQARRDRDQQVNVASSLLSAEAKNAIIRINININIFHVQDEIMFIKFYST